MVYPVSVNQDLVDVALSRVHRRRRPPQALSLPVARRFNMDQERFGTEIVKLHMGDFFLYVGHKSLCSVLIELCLGHNSSIALHGTFIERTPDLVKTIRWEYPVFIPGIKGIISKKSVGPASCIKVSRQRLRCPGVTLMNRHADPVMLRKSNSLIIIYQTHSSQRRSV